MLYRTHHHTLYFPCNAFPSFKSFSPSLSAAYAATTTNAAVSATLSQVEKMECVMKGGYKPEMIAGFGSKPVISDDFCNLNSQNATPVPVSVPGEDFFVDQLLNLNNEDAIEEEEDGENGLLVVVKEEPLVETEAPTSKKVSAFLSPPLETDRNRDDFGSVLSVPAEEADLEWLSHFVEESFSQFSSPYPAGLGPFSEQPKLKPEPGSETPKAPCFAPPAALSKSRRSKRARTGCRVWSTSLADSSSASSPSSTSTTTTSSYPSSPNLDLGPPRKQRKREGGPGGGSPRRCSHCGVQKTPQWRTGPLGAKTLCNACGVRYKSGRLLPEYRPACSPTFSSELHSNNHRKVLEMRKKKELMMTSRPEPNLTHPVPSFG